MNKYIVVVGNPVDGLSFHTNTELWDDYDALLEWAELEFGNSEDRWVTKINDSEDTKDE